MQEPLRETELQDFVFFHTMDIITVQDQCVEYKLKVKFANLLSERLKAVIKKNLVHF